MKKIENQELNQYSDECERVAYSNEYFDIILEYRDISVLLEKFNVKCYKVIDNIFVVLTIPVGEYGNILQDIATIEIPFIYGPYGKKSLIDAGITYFHTRSPIPLRGNGILIAIVDSGIDYTHNVFKKEDGSTKISRIWDQTIPGKPPEGFSFGTEYTMEDINEALKSENPYEIVSTVDRSGHGTFIAGIAAGSEVVEEDFIGAAPDAELVIVKLKEARKIIKQFYFVEDKNEVYQDSDIIQGVQYAINIAKVLNKPLVISLGLGTNLGSHSGATNLELYLTSYARRRGYIISVPAGNEAITAHHYKGYFLEDETFKDVEIDVEEGEKGIYFSIWCHPPDKLSISMTSPLGTRIDRIPFKLSYTKEIKLLLEQTNIAIVYKISETYTGEQYIFVRMENPTSGIWTIRVYGDVIVNGEFDMWLPRKGWIKDETRFLQPDPFTTVTSPGTAMNTFTIGGYDARTGSIYISSGRGLVWDYEMKPDIVAPSVNVWGPLPDNKFGAMTGTSIGTAITGGASALLLEWAILLGNAPEMNTWIAINFFTRGAERKESLEYPNRIWGYGQLDLIKTFNILKDI